MMAYAFLLDFLGFLLCTFLLGGFYLRVIAARRWPATLSFAAAVALASHFFFDVLLKAELPRGLLELVDLIRSQWTRCYSLAQGILTAASPLNLLYGFAGVLLGTLVGVLPGLGPAGAIALLLPLALHAPPLAYLIMLFGITYGAQYGGSTTSILVNIPGEASSVITCLDGYAMARQGRAGPALGIAAFGSFIGGTVAILGVAYLAPALAEFGLRFGPPEYAALMLFGLTALVYLAHGPMDKAMLMALFGIFSPASASIPSPASRASPSIFWCCATASA